jgi:hypothetical protein
MNILEALQAAKNGNIIKATLKGHHDAFVLQTTLEPLGTKSFVFIREEDLDDLEAEPKTIGDLPWIELNRLCAIEYVESEGYATVSAEDLVKWAKMVYEKIQYENMDD